MEIWKLEAEPDKTREGRERERRGRGRGRGRRAKERSRIFYFLQYWPQKARHTNESLEKPMCLAGTGIPKTSVVQQRGRDPCLVR